MIMIDQSKRLSEPLRWTPAGKLAVVVAAVCLVGTLAGLGIYAALGGFSETKRAGCIELTFASTTGAAHLESCGAKARALCSSGQVQPQITAELRAACRRAGYAFGEPGRP
jgi:hypothetical protein